MIITISGSPGSGKSTVAKILKKKLKLKHYSTGDLMRKMAKEKGMSLQELGEKAKTDPSIDKALDDKQIEIGKKEDDFIIDGRLAYHFISQSIKIFIDAKIEERAKRVLNDALNGLREEEQAKNINEMVKEIKARKKIEMERYKKYYKLNPYQDKNYDLVIDSTDISAVEVAEKILEFIKNQ